MKGKFSKCSSQNKNDDGYLPSNPCKSNERLNCTKNCASVFQKNIWISSAETSSDIRKNLRVEAEVKSPLKISVAGSQEVFLLRAIKTQSFVNRRQKINFRKDAFLNQNILRVTIFRISKSLMMGNIIADGATLHRFTPLPKSFLTLRPKK